MLVTSALVAATNVTVICMVVFIKELRTFTNYFVLSLAVSDLLTGISSSLQRFRQAIPAIYDIVIDSLTFLILASGVLSLCAVTWDRYIAVTNPFGYKDKVKRHSKKILIAIWLITITLFAAGLLVWITNDSNKISNPWLIVSPLLIFIVIPYTIIVVAYIRICLRLRSHTREMKRMDITNEQREQARRTSLEGRSVKVLIVVVCVFLISWVPIMYQAISSFIFGKILDRQLKFVTLLFINGSSIINPILYAFFKKDFQKKLARVVRISTDN